MKEVTLKCRVITPLFMGGAYMEPEIRTQSINGIIRWWFRTIGGSFEEEKKIFGWGGEKSQKGGIKYILENSTTNNAKTYSKYFNNSGYPLQNGINYISFSLDQRFKKNRNDKPQRKYFDIGYTFILKIIFSPFLTDEDKKKFLCALWCSFYLGNFGSRSRRGFGSITIDKIFFDNQESTCYGNSLCFIPQNDISNWISENLTKIRQIFNNKFSSFYVFKIDTEVNLNKWKDVVQNGRNGRYLASRYNKIPNNNLNNEVYELLNFMGFTLMAYRSYLEPDYSNAKNIITNSKRNGNEIQRAIFGLPLNFYFSSIQKGGMVNVIKKENNIETNLRRASPIIFKVINNSGNKNNRYKGFIIYLKKGTFLPDDLYLKLNQTEIKKPDYTLIDNYLTSLKDKNILQEVFNA